MLNVYLGGLDGEDTGCSSRDLGSIPGVKKIPWRRAWPPTPVFVPRESHGWRSLVGCSPWLSKESETVEQLTLLLLEVLMEIASGMDCLKIFDEQQ